MSREGGGEAEGTTGDERRPRNAGALGVREEPARVQEEEPRRGAGGGTLPGYGRRNPPGCGRRDPAGSDGYGLGEGPAGTQDVVRAPVTVAQVPSLGQRPRHRHLRQGHVNTRHPPHTHTHTAGDPQGSAQVTESFATTRGWPGFTETRPSRCHFLTCVSNSNTPTKNPKDVHSMLHSRHIRGNSIKGNILKCKKKAFLCPKMCIA